MNLRTLSRFYLTLLGGWWLSTGTSSLALDLGVARIDVTPGVPIRLTGYASRKTNSAGVEQKLWAKALALGSDQAGPAVLVTLDNCGIAEETYRQVARRLAQSGHLPPDRLVIACSHTHCGPCTTRWAPNIFAQDIPADQLAVIDRYTRELVDKLEQVALAALRHRRPGKLSWAQGSVGFARNRRVVVGSTAQFGDNATGPVDPALPVLRVTDDQGHLRALVANYACHCTTLGGEFNRACGDWAGYAQEALERDHPGAVALITIGCGADANPAPRGGADGGLALAKTHGEELAAEVKRLLAQHFTPLTGRLVTRLEHIELPFGPHFTRAQWEERAQKTGIVGYHARKWLDRLDRGEHLPDTLSYYVQTWSFGEDLAMAFLSGEVVVDYALRLKQEFDPSRLWVSGYANYVPCYLPSRRILAEGGYEAEDSLWYYDRPARLSTNIEDLIIKTVHELLPKQFLFDKKKAEFPDPKTPAQALATFRTKADFTVELVAAEPLIESPVTIDWGADGRLWVCEMYDYPAGLDGKFKPGGRIKVLSSTQGDGRYDQATLFLDGLAFPTGVMPWRKGALICAAPDILYAEDTDGDGRADLVRTNVTGFATHNYQARVNGFTWGLDGWLHGSSGLFGGKVRSLQTGREIDLNGRDFRYRPDSGEVEPVAGISQMGRVRDDFDNWFGNDNSTLLWHYPLPDHALRRNPHVTYPEPRVLVAKGSDPNKLFPASRTLERFNDPQAANRVTSGCGPDIYRDELLGPDYYGNAFVCEPVHNLVTRLVLEPDGATFTGHRAAGEERSEFLASTDNWCRPVQVRTGPDGALWVVDMYRFVVEHPRWIPPDRLKPLDVRAGADLGRIYRVYPKSAKLRPIRDLTRLKDPPLIHALDSPNGPTRDLIHRLLLERSSPGRALAAASLPRTSLQPAVRAQCLSLAEALPNPDATELVRGGLADSDPRVRRTAVRLAGSLLSKEPTLGPPLLELLDEGRPGIRRDPGKRSLAHESDPGVRLQLALALGEWNDPRAATALARLAQTEDRWLRAAVLSSAQPRFWEILEAACAWPVSIPGRGEFMAQLCSLAVAANDQAQLPRVLEAIASAPGDEPSLFEPLAALLDAMERHSIGLEPTLTGWPAGRRALEALAAARACATNAAAPEAQREQAIRLLARREADRPGDVPVLCSLLAPTTSSRLQNAALDRLRRQRDRQVSRRLLAQWTLCSPALRPRVLSLLLAREDWTRELVAALQQGTVAVAEVSPAEQQKLLHHEAPDIREPAVALFRSSGTRADVLAKFQEAATLAGSPDHGIAVFEKNCAQCHAFRGHGHAVGPNLVEFAGKSVQDFLVAILDPNSAINPNYLAYNVETKDGRSLSGIVRGETASSLTLVQGGGVEEKILRADIQEIRASKLSLMPEGLEQAMTPQDLADLVAWLKSGTTTGQVSLK